MNLRAWRPAIATWALTALLLAYVLSAFEVKGDITHFLPDSENPAVARISEALTRSEVARTMVLTVEAEEGAATREATNVLAAKIARLPGVAWVRSGIGEREEGAFRDLYFPRRLGFAAESAEDARNQLKDAALADRVKRLRDVLASPMGSLVRPLVAEDPLLAYFDRLMAVRSASEAELRVVDGTFMTHDGRHGVIFLATDHSPFAGRSSAAFLRALDATIAEVRRTSGSPIIERSGLARFAVAAEASMRDDIQRIAIVSSLGIAALLLGVFGSLRFLLLGAMPLVVGMIAAMAATLALFGRIHGVTLAFGASLLGVAIDYVQHYLGHELLAPHPDGPMAGMRRLWPALLLGGASTVLGLFGFFFSSVPGIREMAVFAAVGVTVALVVTRIGLPILLPGKARGTRVLFALRSLLQRAVARLRRGRALPLLIVGSALVLCAVGWPRLRWIDDPSALALLDRDVLAEDRRVQGRIGARDVSKFVVSTARGLDDALDRHREVAARLALARSEGALEGFASLAPWLRSERVQREVAEAMRSADLAIRLPPLLEREGFRVEAFAPFFRHLEEEPAAPLRLADLRASALAPVLAPHVLDLEGEAALVTTLRGVKDLGAVASKLVDLPGVIVLDQRKFLGDAYREFRERALERMIVGGALVLGLVFAWHRRLRAVVAVMLPALLAGASSVAALSLAGIPHNPMNLLALLLVLAMGVDHGIFLIARADDDEAIATTWLGNALSMITTVLSFGLLAMSRHPALSALGLTTGIGVFASFLLAPAIAMLLRAKAGSHA